MRVRVEVKGESGGERCGLPDHPGLGLGLESSTHLGGGGDVGHGMLLMPLGREVDAARVEAHVLVLRYGGGAAALGLVLVPQHTAARQAAPG